MIPHSTRRATFACALALAVFAMPAQAQDFYSGKTIKLIVGNSPGGDYDTAARLMVRHMGRHIPGQPGFIVQNMQGASTVIATNHLYTIAPKDGLVMGSFSRNIPSQAFLKKKKNLKIDPRQFGWIGASSLPSRVCVVRANSPAKSPDDLFTQEVVMGGSGSGSSLSILPTVLNRVLDTKFKVVEGYGGAPEVLIAIERGEVDGICHSFSLFRNQHSDLIKDRKVRILFHAEEAEFPDDPKVPSIFSYAKTDDQKRLLGFIFSSVEFGRPYVLPPGAPKDRLMTLRRAMAETLKDPALVKEAAKQKIDMTYRPPEDLERLVARLYETPERLVKRAKEVVPAARD
jgi:tripartite-type tricarboxylate transporter receptor subunit TctC